MSLFYHFDSNISEITFISPWGRRLRDPLPLTWSGHSGVGQSRRTNRSFLSSHHWPVGPSHHNLPDDPQVSPPGRAPHHHRGLQGLQMGNLGPPRLDQKPGNTRSGCRGCLSREIWWGHFAPGDCWSRVTRTRGGVPGRTWRAGEHSVWTRGRFQ